MKAFVSVLACLIPPSAYAAEEDAVMQKTFRTVTQHRLLSRAELACSNWCWRKLRRQWQRSLFGRCMEASAVVPRCKSAQNGWPRPYRRNRLNNQNKQP